MPWIYGIYHNPVITKYGYVCIKCEVAEQADMLASPVLCWNCGEKMERLSGGMWGWGGDYSTENVDLTRSAS